MTIPAGTASPKGLRFAVKLSQEHTRLGAGGAGFRMHANALHLSEIDDHAAVAHAEPGVTVASASHGDELPVLSGKANRAYHVGNAGAARDQSRATVDRGVPDPALLA